LSSFENILTLQVSFVGDKIIQLVFGSRLLLAETTASIEEYDIDPKTGSNERTMN
jgi:hypothetical protein